MQAQRDFAVISALLALAMLVGGAGVTFPILEMLLQIAAIAAAGYLLVTRRRWRFDPLTGLALAVAALTLLLPALQLLPLPPAVWSELPGRALPARLDAVLGWSLWRPLTLDTESTIRAVLTLLPATAIFLGCAFLPLSARHRLLWVVAALALAGALVAIMQLATGGGFTPYPSAHSGYPIGLFVNRNHNAALCLVAIPIVAMLAATQVTVSPLARRIAALCAVVILTIVILGTTSRMAMLLLPFALASALFVLFFGQSLWRVAVPAVLAFAALLLALFASGGFDRPLMRFSSLDDARFDYWADVHWALQHYGLAGTGIGAFIPVYKSAESLSGLSGAILNHAHNDYLELLLGGGWPAIVLMVLFAGVLAIAAVQLMRTRATEAIALAALSALIGILLLLAFSLVDYPLRMPALSAVFAVLCAAMLPEQALPRRAGGPAGTPQAPRRARGSIGRGAALAGLAVLSVVSVQAGLSGRALLGGDSDRAARIAPWSSRALEERATTALLQSRWTAADKDAEAALRLSPISAPAIRTAGVLRLLQGSRDSGNRLMDLAASLGWRDRITQLWAINAAIASGEQDKAIDRSEALFRQDLFPLPVLHLLLNGPQRAQRTALLVQRLARQPSWRDGFFREGAKSQAADLAAFLPIFDGLAAGPTPPSADEAKTFIARFIDTGQDPEARHLWALTARFGVPANGNFELDPGTPDPKDWDISDSSASQVEVAIPSFASGNALRLFGSGSSDAVMSQRLLLAPGTYDLSFLAAAEANSNSALQWQLKCVASGFEEVRTFRPAAKGRWQPMSAVLTVPSQDCPIQRLALKVAGGTNPEAFWLDDIQLRPDLVKKLEK